MRHVIRQREFLLLVVTMAVCTGIGAANPAFYSLGNVFDLLKSSVTLGILSLGVLVVLVSGGIDISFPAIAVASMYTACSVALAMPAADHLPLLIVLSVAIGLGLGLANAALVYVFRLPSLIVTLGTASLIRGCMLEFVGERTITNLPSSIVAFSKMTLGPGAAGVTSGLTVSFVFLVAAAVLVALVLNYTLLGRGVYALGNDRGAAERVGFSIRRIQFFVYGLMGALAGLAGIIHAAVTRNANPVDLHGLELTVIAAAVIGGASITGGRGTVTGTLLGVLLMVVMNGSLVLVGVPSQWHNVLLGLVIVVSTSVTALRGRPAIGGAPA